MLMCVNADSGTEFASCELLVKFDVTVVLVSAVASGCSRFCAGVGVYNTGDELLFDPADDELELANDEVAPVPVAFDDAADCRNSDCSFDGSVANVGCVSMMT
jgi:hypothetical protein